MIIEKSNIRTIPRELKSLTKGTHINIGYSIDENPKTIKILQAAGFQKIIPGMTVLPSAKMGPRCKYNAEGKEIVHRDRPKETYFQEREWEWKQFHGDDRITKSKTIYIPRERYPRSTNPPPSVELSIANEGGRLIVVAPPIKFNADQPDLLIHTINIFLELFGCAEILDQDKQSIIRGKVKRLNWQVLPRGKYPWERLEKDLKPIIDERPEMNRRPIRERFALMNSFDPEFTAIGRAGFHGYVIFGYPKKKLYVLESSYYGNATYVFQEGWEELSQLTKAEIIHGELQHARVIHDDSWKHEVKKILKA
jgi:hypothetical protein